MKTIVEDQERIPSAGDGHLSFSSLDTGTILWLKEGLQQAQEAGALRGVGEGLVKYLVDHPKIINDLTHLSGGGKIKVTAPGEQEPCYVEDDEGLERLRVCTLTGVPLPLVSVVAETRVRINLCRTGRRVKVTAFSKVKFCDVESMGRVIQVGDYLCGMEIKLIDHIYESLLVPNFDKLGDLGEKYHSSELFCAESSNTDLSKLMDELLGYTEYEDSSEEMRTDLARVLLDNSAVQPDGLKQSLKDRFSTLTEFTYPAKKIRAIVGLLDENKALRSVTTSNSEFVKQHFLRRFIRFT